MNKLLACLLLSITTYAANAQPLTRSQRMYQELKRVEQINSYRTSTAQKGTAATQRLILSMQQSRVVNVNPVPDYKRADSIVYRYGSADRGSVYDLDFLSLPWRIDPDKSYIYNNVNGTMQLMATGTQEYNNHNKLIRRMDTASGSLKMTELRTYDGLGRLATSVTTDAIYAQSSTTIYKYGSNGLLVSDSSISFFGAGGPAIYSKTTYTYNSSNQLTLMLAYSFNGSTAVPALRIQKTYDAQGRIETIAEDEYSSGSWTSNTKDSLVYNGSGTRAMGVYEYYMNDILYAMLRTEDGAGRTVNIRVFQPPYIAPNRMTPTDSTVYEYNAFNNPVVERHYPYDNFNKPGAWADRIYNYYYEEHNPTAVAGTAQAADKFYTYPNPVTGTLYVAAKGVIGSGSYVIRVYDVTGRCIATETMQDAYTQTTLQTAGWAPGNYWLTVTDKTGQKIFTEQVVKK